MLGGPKPLGIEAQGGHGHLLGAKRNVRQEIAPRMFGDRNDVVELLPAIPDQPLFDATIEIGTGTEHRKQQRLDVMDGGHELSAFPGHAGIVREVEHIVRADQERSHLLPETATEQREPDQAISHIRTRGERMLRVRDQNLVVIRLIDAPQGLNQFPGISPDPDVEILEMPCGNDDLHNIARNRPMVKERTGSRSRTGAIT